MNISQMALFDRQLRSDLQCCEIPRLALSQFNMKLIGTRRCAIDVSSSPIIGEGFSALPVMDKFFDQFANPVRNVFQRYGLFAETDQSLTGDRTANIKSIFPWRTPDE